jgi:hypothetical protein
MRGERAAVFARALDADDFDGAESMLAPGCVYVFRGARIEGAAAVMAPYRENGARALRLFDEVRYESSVVSAEGDEATLGFVDHLRKGEGRLVHRCHQRLRFDEAGKISHIEHVDLPGEREALKAFCEAFGIRL